MIAKLALSALCYTLTIALSLSCTDARAKSEVVQEHEKFSVKAFIDASSFKQGKATTYTLTMHPKPGYKIKVETPFKAALSSDKEALFTPSSFTNKDFIDPETPNKSISSLLTPKTKGIHKIKADVTLFVCNEQLCERFKSAPVLEVTAY
jgi:hypothetical protein